VCVCVREREYDIHKYPFDVVSVNRFLSRMQMIDNH
jgi:hypothetical protein